MARAGCHHRERLRGESSYSAAPLVMTLGEEARQVLTAIADDVKRKFNRTENIRQIPQADPEFKRLYRRRNDAESINRALDDTLWLRRAHSVSHERQHLNLLTYALTVNSLALWRHQARRGDPPLSLAA